MKIQRKLTILLLFLIAACTEQNSIQSTSITAFSEAVDAYWEARDFEAELLAQADGFVKVNDETHRRWLFLFRDASEKASLVSQDETFKENMGENVYESLPLFTEGLRLKFEAVRDDDFQKHIQGAELLNRFSDVMNAWQQSENQSSDRILWEWGPISWEPSRSIFPTIGCNSENVVLSWIAGCP
ncbi:MAG: hypothetical protein Q7V56_16895 [Gammaproteobacteria bacterium]|nr:hypothetical protein [Gammaproteobacteria bacterium]